MFLPHSPAGFVPQLGVVGHDQLHEGLTGLTSSTSTDFRAAGGAEIERLLSQNSAGTEASSLREADPMLLDQDTGLALAATSSPRSETSGDPLTGVPVGTPPTVGSPDSLTGVQAEPHFHFDHFGSASNNTLSGGAGNDTFKGQKGDEMLTGRGAQDTFVIRRGDGTVIVTNFGGVGTGVRPAADLIAEVDTLKFEGAELSAQNMRLTQDGSDLLVTFAGVKDTQVILKDFDLEDLDNLQKSTGASVDVGNILFNGQTQIQDSFDVINANQNLNRVFNPNTITFLNNLDNNTQGRNGSNDLIHAQGGNDLIHGGTGDDRLLDEDGSDWLLGQAGDDHLAGGDGDDQLNGGPGKDTLIGGAGSDLLLGSDGNDKMTGGKGADLFWIANEELPNMPDTLTDFQVGTDVLGIGGLGLASLDGLELVQKGADTLIKDKDSGAKLAILTGIQADSLTSASFIFPEWQGLVEPFRVTTLESPLPPLPPATILPGTHFPDLGQKHVPAGTQITYNSNPPTSGPHYPYPAAWGIYKEPPADEFLVHNLEHGGINISYNPEQIKGQKLESLQAQARELSTFNPRLVLTPRVNLDTAIALTAWGYLENLDRYDPAAVKVFYNTHIARGPECQDGLCPS